MPTEDKNIQENRESFGGLGLNAEDESLHLGSVLAIEMSLRRRATNCRRFSWLFLAVIVIAIALSGYIVAGLLAQVQTTEAKILNDFTNRLRDQIEVIKRNQNELKPQIDTSVEEMRKYLKGAGVQWETISNEVFGDSYIADILQTKNGVLLALIKKDDVVRVWKSEDNGTSWEPGQPIVEEIVRSGTELNLQENYLFFTTSISDDTLYLSNDYGRSFAEISLQNPRGEREMSISSASAGDQFALLKFSGGRLENLTILMVSFTSQQVEVFNVPAGFKSDVLFEIDGSGSIMLAGRKENKETLFWTRTEDSSTWNEPQVVPDALLHLAHRSRILLLNVDLPAKTLEISIWDVKSGVVGRSTLKMQDKHFSYWKNLVEYDRDYTPSRFRERHAKFNRLNKNSTVVEIKNGPTLFLQELSKDSVSILPLPEGTTFVSNSYFLIRGEEVNKLAYFDEDKGAIVDGPNIPSLVNDERIVHAVKKPNHWIVLAFSPGEGSVTVYQKELEDKKWQKRSLPSGIVAGALRRGWDYEILEDDTILLAGSFGGRGSQLLRSKPYEIPVDLKLEYKSILDYVHEVAPRTIESWQGYAPLTLNLRRYIRLEDDLNSVTTSLNQVAPGLVESDEETATDKNLIPWGLLTATLVRFLILGLVFFVAKILVNLFRYFLRLAAYYEARADGIALVTLDGKSIHDKLPENLQDLFSSLSPDNVDLGTPPKTPIGEMAEAATKLTQASAELIRKKG